MQCHILLKNKPSNLFLSLALVQLFCTVSYYGTQTLLVLYLINIFHFSVNHGLLVVAAALVLSRLKYGERNG